ncbi:MAG TPA: GatB/YqeY domain-containing protein [Sphingobacteriaceae bacterium]|nr:GatB/YqeY domain-containing protein [Sphingobacteriaceae bacterium]
MALQQQIDQDIKSAMLAKNASRLRGLRAIKAAVLLAKTEKDASENLSDEAETRVLQKLVKQRKESAGIYQAQQRNDLYQIEMEELEVIEAYLPAQMSQEEIIAYVNKVISSTGASGMKDMGKVMGMLNKDLAGKADGKNVSEAVKQALQ